MTNPGKFHINIKEPADFNAEELLKEAVMILYNLDYSTKVWNTHYGAPNKYRMIFWQNKADEFFKKHLNIKSVIINKREDATK